MGFRQDDFNWSVAAGDGQPNILSELTWTDVDSLQIGLENQSRIGRHIYWRFNFNYATIQDGSVRDSDYAGDHRTGEYSRSISQSSGDQLWDIALGVGHPFTFLQGRLTVVPLIGGALNKQSFRITDGQQVVTSSGERPLGPLPGELSSTYRTTWQGGWLGCDLRYDAQSKAGRPVFYWAVSLEYHWSQYSAKADWNLRADLEHPVSFYQEADADGMLLNGRMGLAVTPRLDIFLDLKHLNWSTDKGKDHFNHTTHPHTRTFNGAEWESRSLMLGVTYRIF